MSSSKNSCAACKYLRKRCTEKCIFAPYFPPDRDNRERFIKIHRAFGAGRVAKLLEKIPPSQRKYAIRSLLYEAKTRAQDPIHSCLGRVNILRNMLQQWRHFVKIAKDELATYIASQDMLPILQQTPGFPHQYVGNASFSAHAMQYNMMPKMGIPPAAATAALAYHWGNFVIREPQQEQFFEAQQLRNAVVAAREIQEMFRGYEQQHPHPHHSPLIDETQNNISHNKGNQSSSKSKRQEAREAGAYVLLVEQLSF